MNAGRVASAGRKRRWRFHNGSHSTSEACAALRAVAD